jgi:hypothetical protein
MSIVEGLKGSVNHSLSAWKVTEGLKSKEGGQSLFLFHKQKQPSMSVCCAFFGSLVWYTRLNKIGNTITTTFWTSFILYGHNTGRDLGLFWIQCNVLKKESTNALSHFSFSVPHAVYVHGVFLW